MDCLFCKIAEKQIPANLVYEDDRVVAFRDVNPQAPVHILIIPRRHIATVNDLTAADNELMGHMLETGRQIAAGEGIADGGFRLVLNCNADGGQSVYHIHLHLLGGRRLTWPPG